MTEVLLIIFAAALIYYVATRVAPQGLIFKMKKDQAPVKKDEEKLKAKLHEENVKLKGSLKRTEDKLKSKIKS